MESRRVIKIVDWFVYVFIRLHNRLDKIRQYRLITITKLDTPSRKLRPGWSVDIKGNVYTGMDTWEK